ncbi:MAG: protein kinase domain-containing protein [Chloroflexota bacterium]
MSNLIGQSLGRYHILEQLGEGGMAVVYKAFDTSLERYVALKVVLPYREHSETFLARFRREARALAKLSHPNILKIFDYGEFENRPYLVTEYILGGTLAKRLGGKPRPWWEAAQLLIRVARALEAAHAQGIVHRDVKPSNILLTDAGDPLLSDFGIAKLIQGEDATVDLTGTGAGIGTPEYMAPEQGLGRADERADVYALGVIFYEMVTGRKPYQADTPMAVMLKKSTEPLPRPTQFAPDLPAVVENVLIKALARDPDQRYQTMTAFAAALDGLAGTEGASAPSDSSGLTTVPEEAWILSSEPRSPSAVTENTRGKWIPWAVAAGLIFACCVLVLAGFLIQHFLPTAAATEFPSLSAASPTSPTSLFLPTTVPTLHAGGGMWIAFNSRRAGNADIYLVDLNGDNLTQLTENNAHDLYPAWSPDGKYLAYQTNAGGDQELAIIDIATKKISTLTRDECNEWAPAWSPDGEWIAFYSDCGGERNIYKMRADGSDWQQLTFGSGSYSWFPSWSPDGTKITFTSNRSGRYQVFVMNADGNNQHALADGCVSYFSPDGSQILYGVYCDDTDDLWLMNADGSNQHPITNGCQCKNATWSPDGTKIVFQVSKNGKDGPFALYIMSVDNPNKSKWILLTDYNINGGSPVWQP